MLGKWLGKADADKARVPMQPFHVPPRTTISLSREDWRYGSIPLGPVRVCVERVRWETADSYDAEVWIDGYQVDAAGVALGYAEMLVFVEALWRAAADAVASRQGGDA